MNVSAPVGAVPVNVMFIGVAAVIFVPLSVDSAVTPATLKLVIDKAVALAYVTTPVMLAVAGSIAVVTSTYPPGATIASSGRSLWLNSNAVPAVIAPEMSKLYVATAMPMRELILAGVDWSCRTFVYKSRKVASL